VIFTIVVSNAGPGVATAVSLTDVLDGLTFVALDQTPAASFSCSTPPVGSTGTITCTAGTMAVGASTTFQLTAAIPAEPSVGTYVNRATVVSTNDPNEENNESATVVVAGTTNVSVAKTGPTTANAGANISYTIVVTNAGPDPALDVTLTDVLPPNTTFVSLTPTSGAAASCGDTTCVIPSLDNGETSTFTLTLRAGDTTSITNTATVTSVSYDTNPANNESSVTTAITPQSDLRVAKSGPPTAIADTTITWTVTVANDGPSTASGVTLTDIVPAGTTLVSGAQTGGVAFNCVAGVTLVCTRASMAPGTSATFTVTAHILPGTTGTITNTAQVTAATADPDPADNQATAGAVVSPAQADLRVTKTGPAAVTAGTNITWTVSITNDGPSSASNVVLTDTLPAGTTFVASNQISGPTFTCLPAGNVVTCSAPSMPSATTATLTITAAVGLTTTGPITNTAEVTSTTADPDSSDNRATAVAAVGIAPADVSIAKTANTTEVFPGGTITYTVTATNSGPGEALEVVVTDVLPAGTTLVSAPGCTGTTTLTCNVGTLLAGAQATFTIIVQAPSTLGAFVNAASVASSTPDPTPTNNATSTTATAIAIPAGIPTLSEWALLLMALTLALIALRARAM
jgi:uncharacterized repeat protein (TIGR01451 family)